MDVNRRLVLEQKRPCTSCGAKLIYRPGTTSVTCNYCGDEELITPNKEGFKELELQPYLEELGSQSHSEKIRMIHCKQCGADLHVEENYKSLHCVYCASSLIIEDAYEEDWILPGAILPFQFDQKKSHHIFSSWVKNLWFAPNNLKKAALDPEKTKGLYLPYWTFDAQLYADYKGQRGDYYYVTVPYTTTVNGKTVRKTRRERRTRWTWVSGHVNGFVDDTLIKASQQRSHSLPSKILNWNLNMLKPFHSSFLAGFVTEKYTIPLKQGHLASTEEAKYIARRWAKRDIGGDTQRISGIDMQLSQETFKHILLPVYISSYYFNGKTYHFYVNGQSGAISGSRPYSFWKIFFLSLTIVLIIAVIAILSQE